MRKKSKLINLEYLIYWQIAINELALSVCTAGTSCYIIVVLDGCSNIYLI